MPTQLLTARFVKGAKPPAGGRIEFNDRKVPGLALRVTSQGAKSWSVRYRHRGRLRRLTLGDLDALTLAQARVRARRELHKASDGADPASEKQREKTAETIAELATSYIDKHARPKKRSWKADDRILRAEVLPTWKHRAIADIRRRDVRALVDAIAARGCGVLANRTLSLVTKMFAFAADQDLIEAHPCVRIAKPAKETGRDRVLSDDELRGAWTYFESMAPALRAFYQLRALTAQRGQEVRDMRWADVDLESGIWTIPASVAKNGLAHQVPLGRSAMRTVTSLLATADKKAVYVLDGGRGKRQQAEAIAEIPVGDFHAHDLRRTAATLMAQGGVPRLTIAKLLNHVDRSVTGIYDRYAYLPEKTAALAWWDAKVSSILENTGGANVVPFAKGA